MARLQSMAKRQKLHHEQASAPVLLPMATPTPCHSQSTQTTSVQWHPRLSSYIDYVWKWVNQPKVTAGKMKRLLDVVLLEDRVDALVQALSYPEMESEYCETEIALVGELVQKRVSKQEIGALLAHVFLITALIVYEEQPDLLDRETIKSFGTILEKQYQVTWMEELVPSLMKL